MIVTKIEEKEPPSKELCWFRVTVVGQGNESKEKVFREGARIRNVLYRLQAWGFRVKHGLPVRGEVPYYFFIVECPLDKKEVTRRKIREIAD